MLTNRYNLRFNVFLIILFLSQTLSVDELQLQQIDLKNSSFFPRIEEKCVNQTKDLTKSLDNWIESSVLFSLANSMWKMIHLIVLDSFCEVCLDSEIDRFNQRYVSANQVN